MTRIKVVCIKDTTGIFRGEVVVAFKSFNKMFYKKGMNVKVAVNPIEFWKNFMVLSPYYIVEKPPIKKRFRKPKRQFLKVEFRGIKDRQLALLYTCAFAYVEYLKHESPMFIQEFNYSVVSTLEKLEQLYYKLPEHKFDEAIINCEQVFKEIYKMAIEFESQAINGGNAGQELLNSFMEDNKILSEFFKGMKE